MNTKQRVVTLKNVFIAFLAFAFVCFISVGTLFLLDNNKANEVSTTSSAPASTDLWTDSGNYSSSAPAGSGTEDDPYLISSAEELAWISANFSGLANGKYFLQTANIDLGAHYWNPINNSGSQYSYYYDGNNFEISNLFIDSTKLSSENYVGLFGHNYSNSSCYIKNVRVTSGEITSTGFNVGGITGGTQRCTITNCVVDIEVNGNYNVGGIVGSNWRSTISDCVNKGDITGTGWYIGGLVGENYLSTIQTSYNTGTISGDSNIGGVLGYNVGTVTQVYNLGSVSADWYAGGIAGFLDAGSTVSHCYNKGTLSGTYYMGGIAGQASGSSTSASSVSNSFNVGVISSSSQHRGGIFGTCSSTYLTTSNNYFSTTSSTGSSTNTTYSCGSPSSNSFGTSRTYSAMTVSTNGSRPSGFDSSYETTIWVFASGETPMLVGVGEGDSTKWDGSESTEVPTLQSSGVNSEDNPYIIDSVAKLVYLSENSAWASGKYFLQTVNIDLNFFPWTPIKNGFIPVNIKYDGGNNTIFNLNISETEGAATSYTALFGYVSGTSTDLAYIKNVNVSGGSVSGVSYVGTIVGYAYYTDITNCSSENITVKGNSNVGGLVGSGGNISNSHNSADVSGNVWVGGVAGHNSDIIDNCYNLGTITGKSSSYVGGVCGSSYGTVKDSYNSGPVTSVGVMVGGITGYNSSGVVMNCYNTASVTGGGNYVGGVVGQNSSSQIYNSYNMGTVYGSVMYVGGVVGNSQNGVITNCFNTGTIQGEDSSVGGIIGYSQTDNISSCYNMGNVSGFSSSGGIAGNIYGSTVSNCHNTGEVTSEQLHSGGIVGWVQGSSAIISTISSCYNTGLINSTNYTGGVVGFIYNPGVGENWSRYVSVSWCYYNVDVNSGITAFGYGKGYQVYGLTTEQMQGLQSENYMYLSNSYWNFVDGEYPTLKYVAQAQN